VARMAGWLPEDVQAEHAQIGNVLGSDGKIFRTRSGESVKLSELLDEAVERAGGAFDDVPHDEPFDEVSRRAVVEAVGIGAVKYADLSVAHDSEYVFDLDRMVALTGNTGPYLQYVVARIRSIFRQVGMDPGEQRAPIVVGEPQERALALHLLGFGDVVAEVGDEYEPHRLCAYLFELAQLFSAFYENCPVLKAETDAVRESRLALCAVVFRVMTTGLDLLGIEAPDQM
jgi:arginyl-tRNA synthetase